MYDFYLYIKTNKKLEKKERIFVKKFAETFLTVYIKEKKNLKKIKLDFLFCLILYFIFRKWAKLFLIYYKQGQNKYFF